MAHLEDITAEWLDLQAQKQLRRHLVNATAEDAATLTVEGKRFRSFASNDYLNLSHHPEVIASGVQAAQEYGTGAGASRLVSGNHPLYSRLEGALAAWKGTEAALVFGSGYLANVGAISALAQEGDLIIGDKFCHACMIDGARLSGASFYRYSHNDMASLEMQLKQRRDRHRHAWVMTESIFSMDGDKAPLQEIAALCQRYDAWLLVDDAHGLGTDSLAQADVMVGTLSKALGGYGGYVAAKASVIEYLTSAARSLLFTTGLPPFTLAAALKALEILQSEPERASLALTHAALFCNVMGMQPPQSQIVPYLAGSAEVALRLSALLKERGFWVPAIRPPTVPQGTARLRIAFTAAHREEDVLRLADALKDAAHLPACSTTP
jgi:8-amino-7-oxononanoate synthase